MLSHCYDHDAFHLFEVDVEWRIWLLAPPRGCVSCDVMSLQWGCIVLWSTFAPLIFYACLRADLIILI